jgi:FAD/FMN-containing dehydrogenase
VKGVGSPFAERFPVYVLTELEGADQARDQEAFEAVLGEAMEAGLVADAVLASSQREREGFWRIRDGVAEIGALIRDSGNFDVSVPISRMQDFLAAVQTELRAALADVQVLAFGHIADSNLHFICFTGRHEDIPAIQKVVYQVVGRFEGSVSAEHGIGVQKLKCLHHSRTPEELALMRTLKAALDPRGILNSGRVLPEE